MKRTLAFILSVLMLVSCIPAGAITLETVENAVETTEAVGEAALSATYTATPGLNVVNNKAEVENFDGVSTIDELNVTTGGTSASDTDPAHDIRLNPTAGEDNTTDKVLFLNVYSNTEKYPHVYVPATVEKDRQYYTKLTIYETATSGGKCLWLMNDATSAVWKTPSGYNRQIWYTYSATVTAPADMTRFNYQVKIGDKNNPAERRFAFYVNELAVVPYYKITYTGADVDQVLFADESDKDLSKLMTNYTVKSDNYIDTIDNGDGTLTVCVGWSLTEGGEAVTSVPLANEDITLYPVWQKTEYLSASKTYMSGNAGTKFEVNANGTVSEWSYDAGNTEATVDFSDPTKAVITAAGYPGYVTIYATINGIKANKVIRLIGGEYRKPGLNVLTGTTDVEDYEDVEPQYISTTNEFIGLGLGSVNAGSIAVNDIGYAGNDSKHMVVTTNNNTGNKYPKISAKYDNAEAGRPVQYIAKVVTGYTDSVFLWIQGDNSAGLAEQLKSASSAKKWYQASYKYTPKNANTSLYFQGKYEGSGSTDRRSYYWDDVAFIPYYKVTYIGLDGSTAVNTQYTLYDEGGNLATKYVPDVTLVEGATGYATEKGGNKVPYVDLAYKDITLYAVDTATMFYMNGDDYVEVALTDAEYTLPSAVEGLTLTNLDAWTDGTNFWHPGDKFAKGTDLAGKTLKAVMIDPPLFDREKGDLVYCVNYENTANGATNEWVKNKADYLNSKYVTGLANRMDAVVSGYVATVGGRKVLKNEIAGTSGVFLTGYGFAYDEDTVRGKITAEFDYMFGTDASMFSLSGVRMWRGLKGINIDTSELANGDTSNGNGYVWASPKPAFSNAATDTWYHLTATKTDKAEEKSGLKGATAQITLTKGDTTKIVYFDNFTAYIFPGDVIIYETATGSNEFVRKDYDLSGTYTFPTAEEVLGETPENFIGWTDGTNSYNVGQTVTEDKVMYKVFTPVCDSASEKKAMGFVWDGDTIPGRPCGEPMYTENITDDGRSVLHIAYWQAEKKDFRKDARFSVKTSEHYDPAEYGVLQYSYKISEAYVTPDNGKTYKPTTTGELAVYAHTKADGTYTSPVVLITDTASIKVSDNYQIGELALNTDKWLANGGYGFCFDYLRLEKNSNKTFGGDIYYDYIRVYRSGNANVVYDTNAPEGATVVSEVAADTGRGLGTGYLLKDARPEVDGYVFAGWAETPDATADDVVSEITLDEARKTVYAVWVSKEEGTLYAAPSMKDEIGFREDIEGIRFKADVTAANKGTLNEYGMLIARADKVTAGELDFRTINIAADSAEKAPMYVVGTAYKKGEKDTYFDKNEETGDITFSVVCINIPEAHYGTDIIAKSYAKYIVNGREVVVYGGVASACLNDLITPTE